MHSRVTPQSFGITGRPDPPAARSSKQMRSVLTSCALRSSSESRCQGSKSYGRGTMISLPWQSSAIRTQSPRARTERDQSSASRRQFSHESFDASVSKPRPIRLMATFAGYRFSVTQTALSAPSRHPGSRVRRRARGLRAPRCRDRTGSGCARASRGRSLLDRKSFASICP